MGVMALHWLTLACRAASGSPAPIMLSGIAAYARTASSGTSRRSGILHRDGTRCRTEGVAMGELGTYRAKRDPGRTPEPFGEVGAGDTEAGGRFVVQEHHARRLHYDVRLERGGVLVCWAVPKGLPEKPGTPRLAVHTPPRPTAGLCIRRRRARPRLRTPSPRSLRAGWRGRHLLLPGAR